MKLKTICLAILITNFLSCKTDLKQKNEYSENIKTAKIDSLGNRYLELNRFSGTILVTKKDSIIYSDNFGLADYENKKPFTALTAFKVGKISELITEHIIREMVQKEKLQLLDKISDYIPEINADFNIDDLLKKRTNLPSIKTVKELNPKIEYSTVEYSNLAIQSSKLSNDGNLEYNILGLLIETISGTTFQENIKNLSTKLGLKNTYFQKQDSATAVGYLYNNYRGKGDELHKSPKYNLSIAYSSNGLKSTAHDLMKIIDKKNTIDISGYIENDGFSYSLQNDPKSETAIIVLSNRKHPIAKEISNSINQILQNRKYRLPLLRKPVEIDSNLLNDYTGTYSLDQKMNFNVITKNDSLFVMLGANKIHLIPQSENQFYMKQTDASMRFMRDSSNLVNKVTLLNGFLDGDEAKRLNQ